VKSGTLSPGNEIGLANGGRCVPLYVVWEITLRCNLRCCHCGSRAGKPRQHELTTDECMQVVRQLADLGTREVTLIGGEAYLRRDWLDIIRAVRAAGMDCTIQTGGRRLTERQIEAAAAAGLLGLGVSIDGLQPLHDRLRGLEGTYANALVVLDLARKYGLTTSVNTQITRETLADLTPLFEVLCEHHVKNWQVQLTVAMGNAADNAHLLLQPYQIPTLMTLLAELHNKGRARGILLQPGNNIGYFGPYEALLRDPVYDLGHYSGCSAGMTALGIEADGTIKGCPSLPTAPYSGGNIRDIPLERIWNTTEQLSVNRTRDVTDLWGFCRSCYYAAACLGGCSWTTHVLFGRTGNNPYCSYRAFKLKSFGLRERLVKVSDAGGIPFDFGRFDIVLEESDSLGTWKQSTRDALDNIDLPIGVSERRCEYDKSSGLDRCEECNQYVWPGTDRCPHCGTESRFFTHSDAEELARAESYATIVRNLIDEGRRLREEAERL
jgi:radical SAM protein with 4Fe4S-binding SPASM domain